MGVLQRDSRVWLHAKRRLACPLGRLPMKPNGARRRHRIDVPRRGTPSTQRPVCQLCKALLRIVIGSEVERSLPHSYASKCAGRETKARYYMQYEQPLGDGSPAEGLPSLAPCKEAPSLPTRAPSYEAKRCAPKAQNRCASKRHPSTQWSVCQFCKARLRIVI